MGRAWLNDAPESTSDDELVRRTLSGDRDAFGALWDRHHLRVYGYGMRRLGNREQAQDATAETFRRALSGLRTYRGGGFRSWLFAIAHSAIVDEARANRPTLVLEDLSTHRDEGPPLEERALAEAELARIVGLLGKLSSGEREVVELKLTELTPVEIASVLGKERSAVDAAYHRALIRLRSLLGVDRVATEGRRDE